MLVKLVRVSTYLIVNLFYFIFFIKKLNFSLFDSNLPFNFNISKAKVFIGKALRVRSGVSFNVTSGVLTIGNRVFFNNYCSINCHDSITIGDDVLFGEGVKIYDHDHVFSAATGVLKNEFTTSRITIGNNVWLCSNVVILKGVSIGDNAVIAAGSVVSKDIPASCVYVNGNVKEIKNRILN
ncbi:acyltransferase [Aeromonas media]|uniref:acyltransferase n=1 Tax=Aeromonas media TaxID=651 RepID=UPI00384B8F1F